MGGGEFVRTAAKMAGVGVFNAGLRGVSKVPRFDNFLRDVSRPASVVMASSSSSPDAMTAVGAEVDAVKRPMWEADDWEFASIEDDPALDAGEPKPRVVFGPVPSFQEAKDATTELKEALDKVYLSSPLPESRDPETKSCLIVESSPNASVPKHALQAFKLLKDSAEAQTVVASIASDPVVWKAMLSNQILKDFLQSYQSDELESQKLSEELEDDTLVASSAKDQLENFFSQTISYIKTSIDDMVASASSLLQKLFGVSGDDKATTSGLSFGEKTMGASIMGLVILVVMVVVTKRV